MKKAAIIFSLALVLGLAAFAIAHGPGWHGHGRGGYGAWDCPRYGRHMGPGWGHGPWRGDGYGPQYGPEYREPQKPLGERDARAMLEDYLDSMRNPNLKLGEIKDQGDAFEAEILTKENSLVDRILVDKRTGGIRSVY